MPNATRHRSDSSYVPGAATLRRIQSSLAGMRCSDRRTMLAAARETRIYDGWAAQEIGASCSFFFAARGGVRLMIAIERQTPLDPLRGPECG